MERKSFSTHVAGFAHSDCNVSTTSGGLNLILTNDIWQRVLLICPHPDDETLGAGILLQEAVFRGAEIKVIYLTYGDRNPIAQFLNERQWPLTRSDRTRFGACRGEEAIRALRTLGVPGSSAEFWNLPDQGLRDSCRTGSAVDLRMLELVRTFQPTIVVAPTARDLHVDHVAAAHLTRRAIEACGLRITHLTYRVHGELEYGADMLVGGDSDLRQEVKAAAMNCHRTQLLASRTRMLQLAARDEVLRQWEAEAALPPIRFRGLQRLLHLLPSFQPAAENVEEPGYVRL